MGREGTDQLQEALPIMSGDRILEVGCGTGHTLLRFSGRGDIDLHGVDLLPEMLNAARVRLKVTRAAASLTLADACSLPFSTESFDAAYSESVLGIQKPEAAPIFLSEVFRVLRKGGRFVASEGVWKKGVSPDVVKEASELGLRQFGFSMASSQGWSFQEWQLCMEHAGFAVVRAELLPPASEGRLRRWTGALHNLSFPLALSKLVTAGFRLRGRVSSGINRERRRYRSALARDGQFNDYLEARLFVLEKPDA